MTNQPSYRNVVLFFAAALLLGACGNVEIAKTNARKYADELGYKVVGVACTSTDSDGDGYVSCSVRVDDRADPLALECTRGDFTFTDGCKVAMPKMRATTNVYQ